MSPPAVPARALLEALRAAAPDRDRLAHLVGRLLAARVGGDARAAEAALVDLAAALARLKAAADLAGRVAVRLGVRGPRPDRFAAAVAAAVGRAGVLAGPTRARRFAARAGDLEVVPVVFDEALADLAARAPTVVDQLTDAAAEVARLYGGYRDPVTGVTIFPHGFALARALDRVVTVRAHELVDEALRAGRPTYAVAAELHATFAPERAPGPGAVVVRDWTQAYANTVVRTNVTTAYAAGRHREATALEREGFDVGFEFQTAGDADVRRGRPEDRGENHAALDGIRAPARDRVWLTYSPPLGYSCRCVLTPVIEGPWTPDAVKVAYARGARAAPGFGSRPDLAS